MTDFNGLNLAQPILRAITNEGYTTPTPIQEQSIPALLEGHDLMGVAQTGTGKTAAFALPILHLLDFNSCKLHRRQPRALILAPTRELAVQIGDSFKDYGRHLDLRSTVVFGGASIRTQTQKLSQGVHIVVATPGRLLDLMNQGKIQLGQVELFALDEADRMLDMGFIPDVERIASFLPRIRQTLFFSATFPPEVKRLSDQFLMNPKEITVSRTSSPAETVEHFLVYCSGKDFEKREALRNIIASEEVKNALVFCNRKRDVDVLAKSLKTHGFSAAGLHGDMVQSMRTETLESFKAGKITYLVATDVAGRGIDIQGMSHVFNFDVPFHAEDYIHRIGRTGRAGAGGRAFSLAAPDDSKFVAAIQHLLGKNINVAEIEGINAPSSDTSNAERPTRGRGRGRPAPSGRSRTGRGQKRPPAAAAEATPPAGTDKPSTEESKEAPVLANDTAKEERAKAPAKKPRQARTRRESSSPRKGSDDSRDEKTGAFGDHMPAFLARGPSSPKED